MFINGIAAFRDRGQPVAQLLHHRPAVGKIGALQATDRGHPGRRATEEGLIGHEQLRLVDGAFEHRNIHSPGQLQDAGAGDPLQDVLIHRRRDQDPIAHDEQIHAAGLAHLAPAIQEQGLVEAALHRLGLGEGAGDVSAADLAPQGQGAILLAGPAAETTGDPLRREVIPHLDAIDEKVRLDIVKSGGDAQTAGVNEGAQVKGFAWFVGLQERPDRCEHRLLAQLGEQQPGALGEAAGMAIDSEQQHLAGIVRVGQPPHATKGARAVMEGMGRHREGGLGEGNTGSAEPGIGEELMHGRRC